MKSMKKKKWYAIKDGKGVKDIIFTSWTECEKVVKGYPAIYKSFRSEEEAKNYLDNIQDGEIENIRKRHKEARQYNENRKLTTKALVGIRIPIELYVILENKSKNEAVNIEELLIEAIKIVYQ